jgi:hypothetical protein
MRRQQATANSRNFRSLNFPRKKSNIGIGSVAASHSASVKVPSFLNVYTGATTRLAPRLGVSFVMPVGFSNQEAHRS